MISHLQALPFDMKSVVFGPSYMGAPEPERLALFRDLLDESELADFFEIWERLCKTGRPPPKAAMTPRLLKDHLGFIGITELVPEKGEIIFRLVGSELVEIAGREGTGKSVQDVFPREDGRYERFWRPVFEEARPRLDRGDLSLLGKRHVDYAAVHVPVADSEGCVRYTYFRVCMNRLGSLRSRG